MTALLIVLAGIVWPAIVGVFAYRLGHIEGCVDAYLLMLRKDTER